jgi:hypothetical protein
MNFLCKWPYFRYGDQRVGVRQRHWWWCSHVRTYGFAMVQISWEISGEYMTECSYPLVYLQTALRFVDQFVQKIYSLLFVILAMPLFQCVLWCLFSSLYRLPLKCLNSSCMPTTTPTWSVMYLQKSWWNFDRSYLQPQNTKFFCIIISNLNYNVFPTIQASEIYLIFAFSMCNLSWFHSVRTVLGLIICKTLVFRFVLHKALHVRCYFLLAY